MHILILWVYRGPENSAFLIRSLVMPRLLRC